MKTGYAISRELFIETLGELQKQYEHDEKCTNAFQVILPDTFIGTYDNHFVNNQLVRLLQIAMNDNHVHSWIEYYLHELDFGKKYKEDCASNQDGSNIDLSDAGKVWDFLNSLS